MNTFYQLAIAPLPGFVAGVVAAVPCSRAAHAIIPVALEEGGSLVVLPTVAGFLFALYLALAESFV
jgi:hypothetical protein